MLGEQLDICYRCVQTKGGGLDRMLVEISISDRKRNTSGRKNQKRLMINEGGRRARNDLDFRLVQQTVMSSTEMDPENSNHQLNT